MKLRLHLFIGIVLILTLVLNIFISGCGPETTTTPPPTTPAPTTTEPETTPSKPTLSDIAVTPASPANLDAGSTQQFTATGTYSDGSTSELFSANWNSDNPNVATIDSNGLATGLGEGETNITATLSGIASPPVSLTVVGELVPTTPPEANVISYLDAKEHIGETVTIEDKVFEKIDAGDFWVLFFGAPSTDANAVGIEVNKSDLSKFPEDLYVGRTIRMTGELHANPVGGASFSLTDPSQVEEVEE